MPLLLRLVFVVITTLALCILAAPAGDKAHASWHSPFETPSRPRLSWTLKPTGSKEQFRGLSPVSDKVVWLSGTNATVLKTTNGGDTWESVGPSLSANESSALQLRDIQAWSEDRAVTLSIGEAADSRIYSTRDGGKTWMQSFVNQEPAAFFDCIAFEDRDHGIAMSDPVNDKFRLIETFDGGESWSIVDSSGMPPALKGEAGFAASGTCLEAAAGRWYLASGGVNPGRIFRSDDGFEWQVSNSTIAGAAGGGVFSVRFRDSEHGIALGGDFENPTSTLR